MSEAAVLVTQPIAHALPELQPVLSARATGFRPLLRVAQPHPAGVPYPTTGNPVGQMFSRLEKELEAEAARRTIEEDSPADTTAAPSPWQDGDGNEEALARARSEGFDAGCAEGRRHTEAAFGMRLQSFDRLLDRLAAERAVDPAAAEAALFDVALHLIRAVLEDEPELARQSLAARLQGAAVRLAERTSAAVLRLNPQDYAALASQANWPEGLRAEPDPALPGGDFVMTAGDSRIDDSIDERLLRLAVDQAQTQDCVG